MTICFGGEATLAVPNVNFFCAWVSHVMLMSVSASVSYILPRAISYAYAGVIYLEHDIFTWYRAEGYE